jgi:transcription elongation factor GreA
MPRKLPIVERIESDLAEFKRELSIEIPKALEEARAHGDLKENAEYHAAKERQGMLHARIGALEERLASISMYNLASIPKDAIGYGSRVEVEDTDSGDTIVFELVFPEEAEPDAGRISLTSPTGQALLRKVDGEEVKVQTPRGPRNFEILEFTTIHAKFVEDD